MGQKVGLYADQHFCCWTIQGFQVGFFLLGMKMREQEFRRKRNHSRPSPPLTIAAKPAASWWMSESVLWTTSSAEFIQQCVLTVELPSPSIFFHILATAGPSSPKCSCSHCPDGETEAHGTWPRENVHPYPYIHLPSLFTVFCETHGQVTQTQGVPLVNSSSPDEELVTMFFLCEMLLRFLFHLQNRLY